MLRKSWLLGALLTAALLAGCEMGGVVPPRGVIYNDEKAPLFGGRELGTKEGCASTYTILFLFAWGDASITAAAREGDITHVKQTNYRLFNILGIYQRYTTIVRGD
jgi:hypothetical protein